MSRETNMKNGEVKVKVTFTPFRSRLFTWTAQVRSRGSSEQTEPEQNIDHGGSEQILKVFQTAESTH